MVANSVWFALRRVCVGRALTLISDTIMSQRRPLTDSLRSLGCPLQMATKKKCFAEFLGTFALVFAGTGAIVINDVSGGTVTHVGIALTFGLVVLAMIYAIGDISGAHLNPAVSIAFWLSGRFCARQV